MQLLLLKCDAIFDLFHQNRPCIKVVWTIFSQTFQLIYFLRTNKRRFGNVVNEAFFFNTHSFRIWMVGSRLGGSSSQHFLIKQYLRRQMYILYPLATILILHYYLLCFGLCVVLFFMVGKWDWNTRLAHLIPIVLLW